MRRRSCPPAVPVESLAMASETSPPSTSEPLPGLLRPWFWDCDFDRLSWSQHRDFVVRRILSLGSWDAVCWLRKSLGDPVLRQWIERHEGRGLSSRQLRFFELMLDLPPGLVDAWLESPGRRLWEGNPRR